ncbi:hypothetical protein EBU71_03155 [bacterium]|nr:hypothetical protein [Candidatus Elulimicrobium humile]
MSIFALNNNAVFPNADGFFNQQNVKVLFGGSPIGKSNPISGIIDGCRIRNLSYIQESSGKIDNISATVSNIVVQSDQTFRVRFLGLTTSYGIENFSDGVVFLGDIVDETSGKNINGIYKINWMLTQTLGSELSKNINFSGWTSSDVFVGLTTSSQFGFDTQIQPKLLTLHKLKIQNSQIYSGFFKRALLEGNSFDSQQSDIRIEDADTINKLRISNSILSKSNNFTNTTLHSSIITSANFISGLVNNSIWKGVNFLSGIFNNSTWLSGTFSGRFLSSYTYSTPAISFSPFWKGWYSGDFGSGDFEKSLWIDGNFKSGNFFLSDWLGGTFSDGTLGRESLEASQTTFGVLENLTGFGRTSSNWIGGTVKNAVVGGRSYVYWSGGNFNSGQLNSTSPYFTTWTDGNFNSGRIQGNVIWKGGNFNNGSFNSTWGLGTSLTSSEHFSWQGGRFNSGVFGSGDGQTNSNWWDGEFWGGVFKGRVWNGGSFYNGDFIGGYSASVLADEQLARNYFTGSFWGLWRSGLVIDNPNNGTGEKEISTPLKTTQESSNQLSVNFQNSLWVDGTFSHDTGVFFNSVWLQGKFIGGNFRNSTFNPWVNRTGLISGETQPNSFNLTQSCIWLGGNFIDSQFHISEWVDGNFISGTMTGAIWHSGVWDYGFAQNILWRSGRWRNGNWNGTPFTSSTPTIDSKISAYIKRVNSYIPPTSEMSGKLHYTEVGSYSVNPTELIDFTFNTLNTEYWIQSSNSGLRDWTLTSVATVTSGTFIPLEFSEFIIPQTLECLETSCQVTRNVFRDTNFTYRLTITARCFSPDNVYLFVKMGSFTGSSYNPSSGNVGNYNGNIPSFIPISSTTPIGTDYVVGTPIIHLNNTLTTYVIDYSPKAEDSKDLLIQAYNANTALFSGLEITQISLKKIISNYNTNYNNKLVGSSTQTTPTIPFPNTLSSAYNTPSDNGRVVPMSFGNGSFIKGVWENGVWNNGWRGDENCWTFSNVSNFIKTGDYTYTISITGDNSNQFSGGERVAISNIVGVDTNLQFALIKSPGTILEVSSNSLKIEFVSNTPLRGVSKDSTDHNIKVTKNIWQSGAILNGYFSGVMLYGLVRGFSQNLVLEDTHLVDGIFEGGQIRNGVGRSLIQNFNFSDGSYLLQPDKTDPNYSADWNKPLRMLGVRNRKFNSWINLDWVTTQRTNTYENINYFSEFFDQQKRYLNHTSYTTNDILRSLSQMRNISNTKITGLSLGKKFSTSISKISGDGLFNYVTLVKNGISSTSGTLLEFFRRGWSYSVSQNSIFSTYSATFSSNYDITDPDFSNLLRIETTTPGSGSGFSSWNFTNVDSQLNTARYSLVEFEIYTYSGSSQVDFLNFGTSSQKYPRIYFNNKPIDGLTNLVASPVDHLGTNTQIKREYFYNIQKLDFSILGGSDQNSMVWTSPSSQIWFSRINFYELDSIPFFNYYIDQSSSQDRVDRFFKTPNRAIAPKIDYSRLDFDFIGSVRIYR